MSASPLPCRPLQSGRPVRLLGLPLELKEQIYEYCLVNVSPPTYVVYKHVEASNWSFRRGQDGVMPALLLVCQAMREEVLKVLCRVTEGPVLRVSPKAEKKWCTKVDETQCVFDLEPVLWTTRKVKLEVNLNSSIKEQGRLLGLLRWVTAVLDARRASSQQRPIEWLRVEIVLESLAVWPKEKDSLWQMLSRVSCENLSVACVWRRDRLHPWEREEIESLSERKVQGGFGGEGKTGDLLEAREALLASCRVRRCRLGDVNHTRSITTFQTIPTAPKYLICLAHLGHYLMPKFYIRWSGGASRT